MSPNIDYWAGFIKLRFNHLIYKHIFTLTITTITKYYHLKYLYNFMLILFTNYYLKIHHLVIHIHY